MSQDLIQALRRQAFLYLILGVLITGVGIKYLGPAGACVFPLVIGGLALFFFTRSVSSILSATNLDREQVRQFQQGYRQQFARENLPRQVFWLLFAVAEADGKTEDEERELVRRFLLERFTDPATAADLRQWEADRIPPEQVGALALGLGQILSPSERETVFSWCCLVAFADEDYTTDEHIVLQTIARSFGFAGHHARRIFHHAKGMHLRGEQHTHQGHAGQTGGAEGAGRGRTTGAVTNHSHALKVLGLQNGATKAEIKKRHRELVREFHPDKHQHLGEVAALEAEGRFREVQAAYELLVG